MRRQAVAAETPNTRDGAHAVLLHLQVGVRTRRDHAQFARLVDFCRSAVADRGMIGDFDLPRLVILLRQAEPAQVARLVQQLRRDWGVDARLLWFTGPTGKSLRFIHPCSRISGNWVRGDDLVEHIEAPNIEGTDRAFRGPAQYSARLGDVALAAACLILLSPLLLLLALTVKITSPGPVLTVYTRRGRDGRRCHVYRFRAQLTAAETLSCIRATDGVGENDLKKFVFHSKHSSVGRFLMESRLDRLPQLWNVLRGDLTLRRASTNSRWPLASTPRNAPIDHFRS